MVQCKSLDEVRSHIDEIDKAMIKLIAQRSGYVKQAAVFKKDNDDVRAPQRVEKVIAKVRILAEESGVSPDIVEGIYRKMIELFVNMELGEHTQLREKDDASRGL